MASSSSDIIGITHAHPLHKLRQLQMPGLCIVSIFIRAVAPSSGERRFSVVISWRRRGGSSTNAPLP